MKEVLNFILENWDTGLLIGAGLLELALRLAPTEKSKSLINTVFKILDAVIPNIRKGGGKHTLKVIVFFMLLSGAALSQTNGNFKNIASTNADSTLAKTTAENLFRTYGAQSSSFYYNYQSKKWRILVDSAGAGVINWEDMFPDVISGGGTLSFANNGVSTSADTVQFGGSLTKNTDVDGAYDLTFGGGTPLSTFNVTTSGNIGLTNGISALKVESSGPILENNTTQFITGSSTITSNKPVEITATGSGTNGLRISNTVDNASAILASPAAYTFKIEGTNSASNFVHGFRVLRSATVGGSATLPALTIRNNNDLMIGDYNGGPNLYYTNSTGALSTTSNGIPTTQAYDLIQGISINNNGSAGYNTLKGQSYTLTGSSTGNFINGQSFAELDSVNYSLITGNGSNSNFENNTGGIFIGDDNDVNQVTNNFTGLYNFQMGNHNSLSSSNHCFQFGTGLLNTYGGSWGTWKFQPKFYFGNGNVEFTTTTNKAPFVIANGFINGSRAGVGSYFSNSLTHMTTGWTQINTTNDGFTGGGTTLTESDVVPKAAFEVVSTVSGILPPRLTSAQFGSFPAGNLQDGLFLYESTNDIMYARINGVWVNMIGSPGGSNTQIQFNNSGAFGASANFTWDNSNSALSIGTGGTRISSTGTNNTFVGSGSGNFTTSGTGLNTGFGVGSLASLTVGHSNTAIGYNAGNAITNGLYNTAIGREALDVNNTGDINIAIGLNSMGSNTDGNNNIGIGENTLLNNLTGNQNIALGTSSGLLTTGSNNLSIGQQAGSTTSGSENIAIGHGANAGTTGSNNISIGQSQIATAGSSNQLVIQNIIYGTNNSATGTTISTGEIGIGDKAPGYQLTITGNANNKNLFAVNDDGGRFILGAAEDANGTKILVGTGANEPSGTAVLVGGTVTVNNTSVTANSIIMLTSQADGGTPGDVRVSTRTAGTSFTITSSSGSDTSTVGYFIIQPN